VRCRRSCGPPAGSGAGRVRTGETTRRSAPKATEPSTGPGTNHLNSVLWEAFGFDSGGHENTVTISGAVSVRMRTSSRIRARNCDRHIRAPPLVFENRSDPPTCDLNHATQVVPPGERLRTGGCGPGQSVPGEPVGRPIAGGPVRQRGARRATVSAGDSAATLSTSRSTSARMSRSWPRRCPPRRRLFDRFTLVRLVSCPPRHIRCNSRSCCVGSDGNDAVYSRPEPLAGR
jgi:hypothetical protein